MNVFTVLTLIFLILKLCHQINWSWWIIMLPFISYASARISVMLWWESKTDTEKLIYLMKNYGDFK